MSETANRKSLWGAVGMILAATLLIFYSFTIEQRRMIGDEAGHDPGSRALPLGSGLLILIASLYDLGKHVRTQIRKRQTLRVQPRPETFQHSIEAKDSTGVDELGPPSNFETSPEPGRETSVEAMSSTGAMKAEGPSQALRSESPLFWGTLMGSILYLFLLEWVGFLILTTLFLYLLFVFYGRGAEKRKGAESDSESAHKAGERTELRGMIKGGILACTLVCVCYVAGRIVSRELFYWGRSMGSLVMASRTVSVLVFLLISGCIYGGAFLLGRKTSFWKVQNLRWSVFLSVGTSLALFIVFRLIFRVALPLGILDL